MVYGLRPMVYGPRLMAEADTLSPMAHGPRPMNYTAYAYGTQQPEPTAQGRRSISYACGPRLAVVTFS